MEIKKLQNIVEKIDYKYSDKKKFLEDDINLQLIRLLKEENILSILENEKLKNILATFLGHKIKFTIIENEEVFINQINNDFYKKIIIPNLSPLDIEKSINFWENVTKEYKKFIKEKIKETLKEINIKEYLINGIVNSLVKKDNIGKLYLFCATNFMDSLSKKDSNYLRINKFLINYFSGHQVIIGVRRYIMPKFDSKLYKTDNVDFFIKNSAKLTLTLKNNKAKIAMLKEDIKNNINKLTKFKKALAIQENKLYNLTKKLEEESLKISKLKKVNYKLEKKLEKLSIIDSLKIPKLNKEIKKNKGKLLQIYINKGSLKEQIKDTKHNIFILKEKTQQINKALETKKNKYENFLNETEKLKNNYLKIIQEFITNLHKKKKAL